MSENSERKLRAVIDTNIFVSALIRADGPPDQVVRAWEQGDFVLITSGQLNLEVATVLTWPRLIERFQANPVRIAAILATLAATEHVIPLPVLPIQSRDPKDNVVLACAVGGAADYLVTGDDDLLTVDRQPALGSLRIVTPTDFMELLNQRS